MGNSVSEHQLLKHIEFEQLVMRIFTSFINLDVSEIDNEINRSLKEIGSYAGVDRSYVFAMIGDGKFCSNTHEWCAEGVKPEIDNLKEIPSAFAPYCFSFLSKHQIVIIPSVKDLPPEAASDKEVLEPQGVQSLILVPMSVGGELTGFIGFDWVQNPIIWDENHIPLLRIVGEIIAQSYDRKKSSKLLVDYQQKLRSLASELSLTEERERRKLATDLHDRVGQSLAIAKLRLGIIQNNLEVSPDSPVTEVLDLITQSIDDIRTLTFELSPPILYDLGLVPALGWLAQQMGKEHGFHVEVNDDKLDKPLNSELNVEVYKVVRELLMNVAKHARASFVDIKLIKENNFLVLSVADNGIGIPAEGERESNKKGFGLFSIRERLGFLGGEFSISALSDSGSEAVIKVPLTTQKQSKVIV